jgi:uncharacterized membrane protein (UPF0127 family)
MPVSKLMREIWTSFFPGPGMKPDSIVRVRNTTRGTDVAGSVKIANQSATRRKGLLGHTGLAPEEGLWIIPCESVHTFFMKFPIDLIYVDRNLKVKKVRSNVPAWRLSACLTAHSILELSPGAILRSQTQPGDLLEVFAVSEETAPSL